MVENVAYKMGVVQLYGNERPEGEDGSIIKTAKTIYKTECSLNAYLGDEAWQWKHKIHRGQYCEVV